MTPTPEQRQATEWAIRALRGAIAYYSNVIELLESGHLAVQAIPESGDPADAVLVDLSEHGAH